MFGLLSTRLLVPRALAPLARPAFTRTFITSRVIAFPAAKKTATKSKTKASSTKKAASKKKTTKTATKKTTAPKKKAAAKKPVEKKKPGPVKAKPIRYVGTKMGPPARTSSSFGLFIGDRLKGVTNIAAADRMKAIASEWKALPESEREVYRQRAAERTAQLKVRYDEWLRNVDPKILKLYNDKRSERGIRRVNKRVLGPKVPLNAYFRFALEKRGELYERARAQTADERSRMTLVSGWIKNEWAGLTAEQKRPYEEASNAAFAQYREEKAKWIAEMPTKTS